MPKRTPKTEATVTDITKPKRAKQGELAGFEAPSHPELDALMVELAAEKSTLGTVRQRIGELNGAVLAKAAELKLSTYRNDTAAPPLLLVIKAGEAKVKVSAAKGAAVEDEESDE